MDGGVRVGPLLEQARGGEPKALDRLLESFRNYLRLLARASVGKVLRSKADASDAVQETLIRAHARFRQFRGTTEAELLSWLRRILVRTVIDLTRRFHTPGARTVVHERSLNVLLDRSSQAIGRLHRAARTTPSLHAERREVSLVLADAMAALAPEQREVIALRTLDGRSWDEVAERMGRSAGAVRQLWLRSLRKLRPLIESRLGT